MVSEVEKEEWYFFILGYDINDLRSEAEELEDMGCNEENDVREIEYSYKWCKTKKQIRYHINSLITNITFERMIIQKFNLPKNFEELPEELKNSATKKAMQLTLDYFYESAKFVERLPKDEDFRSSNLQEGEEDG